jgi:hypothetical protein
MDFYRQEIQGYLHAYRLVSGVDLSDETNLRRPDEFTAQPSELMQRQRTPNGATRRQFADETAMRRGNGR